MKVGIVRENLRVRRYKLTPTKDRNDLADRLIVLLPFKDVHELLPGAFSQSTALT